MPRKLEFVNEIKIYFAIHLDATVSNQKALIFNIEEHLNDNAFIVTVII